MESIEARYIVLYKSTALLQNQIFMKINPKYFNELVLQIPLKQLEIHSKLQSRYWGRNTIQQVIMGNIF